MNEVFNKLGIYDLIAVLLTGICISALSLLSIRYVFEFDNYFTSNLEINETFLFLIISYFVGLTFQEIGSFLQRNFLNKNNFLLKRCMKENNKSNFSLTVEEKKEIYNIISKKTNVDIQQMNEKFVFNYCKFYLINEGDTSRIDRDQSLSAMSRSLSLFFIVLSIFSIVSFCFTCNMVQLISFFVSLILFLLFFARCLRFNNLRFIYILRNFYYNCKQ